MWEKNCNCFTFATLTSILETLKKTCCRPTNSYINRERSERRGDWRKNARVCANLCHKPSRNLFCVANNLVAQNDRIPCRQKKNIQCGSSCEVGFSRPVCCKRSAMIHAQTPTLRKLTSPLSKNSQNTVYKLRFANVLGRINADLKRMI